MLKISTCTALLCGFVPALVAMDHQHHAQHTHHQHGLSRHSDAPAGVMGDHVHAAGGWMFSYRFMRMSMDGMRDGTDRVSTGDLLDMMGDYQYMMVPTAMNMDMHMLGAMYGVNDRLTLMVMLNRVSNDMDVERRMGTPRSFSTESSGMGDTSLSALYLLAVNERQQFHMQCGLSLPTGSITEKDDTPMGDDLQLPYSMQLGSGTIDLLPGITWLGGQGDWSWGAQANAVLRTGENDQDYTLGNRSQLTAWLAWRRIPEAALSLRLNYEDWGNIDGADKDLMMMPAMNPNADPDKRGGTRMDLGLGLSSDLSERHRLAVEVLVPVHQDLDGPQMDTELSTVLSYQLTF